MERPMMERPMNVTITATRRGGLIGWISGNSKRITIERGIQSLNRNGYHVILVVDDEWGLLGSILRLLLLFGTLGMFTLEPGQIVIGERDEELSQARTATPRARVQLGN